MPKTWSVAVFFSAACLLILSACVPNAKKFAIVSPEQGQLIRDASSFEIEVMISAEDFDLSTLQAELNGSPLALDNKGDTFAAALASSSCPRTDSACAPSTALASCPELSRAVQMKKNKMHDIILLPAP